MMRRLGKSKSEDFHFSCGKRGQNWMTEETLKVILSVVVIFVLVLLVVKIVSIFMQNTEYEQAKASIGEIKGIMDGMNRGDTKFYLVEGPRRWAFMNYPNRTQLCFCPRYIGTDVLHPWETLKNKALGVTDSVQKNLCNSRGVCLEPKITVANLCYPELGSGADQAGCSYIDVVPYEIKITKDLQGNLAIAHVSDSTSDSNLPPVSSDIGNTKYTSSIYALNNDAKFQELIKNYLTSSSDQNKQAVITYISSLDFVKVANSEGKIWQIKFDNGAGTLYGLTIYPEGVLSSDYSSSFSDQANLNLVSVGDKNYNIVFEINAKKS
ncbi:Uncharacterised protein [uncultured archaeon]|nr:Uncharacterised protein [uncultured archaeon]